MISGTWLCSKAQPVPVLKHEKGFRYAHGRLLDSLHIPPPDFKETETELRIWTFRWSDGKNSLVLLRQASDGTWHCLKREFNFYNDKNFDFHGAPATCALKETWKEAWHKIVDAGYLNLPEQEDVNRKLKSTHGHKLVIADGISYTIEILTDKKKRNFTYSNP